MLESPFEIPHEVALPPKPAMKNRKGPGLFSALGLGFAFLGMSCGFSTWPDREALKVDSLTHESLGFYPGPRRYIQTQDSLQIRIQGMHTGYACTVIESAELKVNTLASQRDSISYQAHIKATVPSIPDCPLEEKRDTVLHFLSTLPSGKVMVLADALGETQDGAQAVIGQWHRDTLAHIKNALNLTALGPYLFTDENDGGMARLYADSLPECAALSHAWANRRGDTALVIIHWVEQDTVAWPPVFPCHALGERDSIPVYFFEG